MSHNMSRSKRAVIARETVAILEHGSYRAPSGHTVGIASPLKEAVRSTKLYRPTDFPDDLALPSPPATTTAIEVTSESTLQAARRLAAESSGDDPFCLNFASAKNAGGGFLEGSQAQEESLARSSGLYACIGPVRTYYNHNRQAGTSLYSDHMIYSPRVPVFRDDDGHLLEEIYCVSFLTAPAVNAGAVRQNEAARVDQIEPVMRERMRKLLWVAAEHGHRVLILGAWGCGVFANDPAAVARLFAEQLRGDFAGRFERVVFAIFDRSAEQSVLEAFRKELADG